MPCGGGGGGTFIIRPSPPQTGQRSSSRKKLWIPDPLHFPQSVPPIRGSPGCTCIGGIDGPCPIGTGAGTRNLLVNIKSLKGNELYGVATV